MAEGTIDVLKAQLVRQFPPGEPWGLELQGGSDFGQPLTILRVTPDSPAFKIGLKAGDALIDIDGISTSQLKKHEALDLVELGKGSLQLTIERRIIGNAIHTKPFQPAASTQPGIKSYQPFDMSGSSNREHKTRRTRPHPVHNNVPFSATVPVNPVAPQQQYHQPDRQMQQQLEHQLKSFDHQQQLAQIQQTFKSYQPVDLSGPRYYQPAPQKKPADFHTAVSRPFVDTKRSTSTPQGIPESFPSDPAPARHYWTPTQSMQYEESPQSRTFRMLQSVMENEEPYAGVDGLPGPRSASREQMRHHMESNRASPRVKVLMAQKYNSPLGIYSPENVIETFAGHAETALGSVADERPNMNQHSAVYASDL